jgi:hypothetical protein
MPDHCCAEIRKRKGPTRWGGCSKKPVVSGTSQHGVLLAYCKRHLNRAKALKGAGPA